MTGKKPRQIRHLALRGEPRSDQSADVLVSQIAEMDFIGDNIRDADEHDQLIRTKPNGPYTAAERETIDAGNEARADLYRHAQDELVRGQITDIRLRLWFIEEVEKLVEALPAPAYRPGKAAEKFVIALRVQILRTDPETLPDSWTEESYPWIEDLGMTPKGAVRKVAEATGLAESTVRTYYQSNKQAAKDWIAYYGPRLPVISGRE